VFSLAIEEREEQRPVTSIDLKNRGHDQRHLQVQDNLFRTQKRNKMFSRVKDLKNTP